MNILYSDTRPSCTSKIIKVFREANVNVTILLKLIGGYKIDRVVSYGTELVGIRDYSDLRELSFINVEH